MLLFIDRLPLYSWLPPRALPENRLLSVSLPLLVTNPGKSPRLRARPQRWALDTRFTGEAFAWRHHLVEAGLDPRAPAEWCDLSDSPGKHAATVPLASSPPLVGQQYSDSPGRSFPDQAGEGSCFSERLIPAKPGKQLSVAGDAGVGRFRPADRDRLCQPNGVGVGAGNVVSPGVAVPGAVRVPLCHAAAGLGVAWLAADASPRGDRVCLHRLVLRWISQGAYRQ